MLFLVILLFIPVAILLISLLMNMRSTLSRETLSPFECGFDPLSISRIPFSLRFFLLMVLFLVFDIEIVLMLPIPLSLFNFQFLYYLLPFSTFIFILLIGLLHEWNEGSLDWAE